MGKSLNIEQVDSFRKAYFLFLFGVDVCLYMFFNLKLIGLFQDFNQTGPTLDIYALIALMMLIALAVWPVNTKKIKRSPIQYLILTAIIGMILFPLPLLLGIVLPIYNLSASF